MRGSVRDPLDHQKRRRHPPWHLLHGVRVAGSGRRPGAPRPAGGGRHVPLVHRGVAPWLLGAPAAGSTGWCTSSTPRWGRGAPSSSGSCTATTPHTRSSRACGACARYPSTVARQLHCLGNDGLVHLKHSWLGVWCNPLVWVRQTYELSNPVLTCLWCVGKVFKRRRDE